jgi:putative acetyltransferase
MTGSPAEPGFHIRAELPSDREAVRRVAAAAFADEGSTITALLDALDAAGRVVVGLVAELDGSVVGHVQLNRSWLDARERLVDVLVLSPLSVGPGHQGRRARLRTAVGANPAGGVPGGRAAGARGVDDRSAGLLRRVLGARLRGSA